MASDTGTPARGDVHLLTEFCWGFSDSSEHALDRSADYLY